MTNNQLPVDLERIKADADAYVRGLSIANSKAHQHAGYIAGATAERGIVEKEMETWNYLHKGYNKALEDQKLKAGKLAEAVDEYFNAPKGQYMYYRMKLQSALEQWRGKEEVSNPCPHCGKELNRDRNLCCRECGKEVEG